jgi:hypothetical protein
VFVGIASLIVLMAFASSILEPLCYELLLAALMVLRGFYM